jgi:hypothetical protein
MASLRLSQGIVSFDIGLGLIGERQCVRCVEGRRIEGFAVDEAMQQVQHMRLGRNAGLQCHVDGREHCLFVVLENKCQDFDHLPVAAWLLEQVLLQGPEGFRKLNEWSTIAKSAGLAFTTARQCRQS